MPGPKAPRSPPWRLDGQLELARATSAKSAQLQKLYADFWEEGLKLNPIQATFQGDDRYNDQLPDMGSAEFRVERLRARSLPDYEALLPWNLDRAKIMLATVEAGD